VKVTSAARAMISISSPSAHSATRDTIAAGTASLMPAAAGMSYVAWASWGMTTR